MKRKYVVLQEEISDCGVCSLLSIIRYYKGEIPLEELRINSLTDKNGVTAYNLIECAKKYGFQCEGLKLEKIEAKYLPCIAHLTINKSLTHFVTIYKITDNEIIYMDPSSGFIKKPIESFYKKFSGVIIYLYPRTTIPKKKTEKVINRVIKHHISKENKTFIAILIINILLLLLLLTGAFLYNVLFLNIKIVALIILLINILINVLKYFITIKIEKLKNKVEEKIMDSYFMKILKLPLKYMQLKGIGEIQKRILDIENIIYILIETKIQIILNLIIIIISGVLILLLKKEIIVLIIIFILLILIIVKIFGKRLNEIINQELNDHSDYNNILLDTIEGIKTISRTSSYNYFHNLLMKNKINYVNSSFNNNRYTNTYNLFISLLEIVLNISINILLLVDLHNNSISIELYMIITLISSNIITSIIEIINLYPSIRYKNSIINKTNEFLSLKKTELSKGEISNYDISIKNLNYSYNKIDKVINNISFDIKKGEKICIKGKNGSGKSTICKLIFNEIDDYEGSIKIGGIEVSKINKKEIEKYISYISQEEKLFKMTIKENILLGKEYNDSDINKIIKICKLDTLLNRLPFGIDTFLIGGGEELSQGEKELIILARYLIRNKKIIIIDEASSHIASNLENEILNNIFKYYKDRTIIFVSHRNNEKRFERIIMLH